MPIPVATQSKGWICGPLLAGISGSNPAEGMDGCLSVVSAVFCRIEISASVDHSSRGVLPSEVCQCDREACTLRRLWPTKGCRAMGGKTVYRFLYHNSNEM